jgi:hypothetical protein
LVDDEVDGELDDDVHEPTQEEEEGDIDEEWEALARARPNRDTGENGDPEDNLGTVASECGFTPTSSITRVQSSFHR